jgi:RND family efflux transporter MFP subunit
MEEDLSKLKIERTLKPASTGGNKRKLYWILAVVLILASLTVLYGKGLLTPAVSVEVTTVGQWYPSQSLTLLNASGYVVAQRKAAVASKVTGRLISLLVEEGSRVKKGETIARLESEDVRAYLEQAGANLEIARFNLEKARAELGEATLNLQRSTALLAKDLISRADYDATETRFKTANAGVKAQEAGVKAATVGVRAASVSLEYTNIRVPFDAVVLTKNADIGDIVTPLGAAANAKAAVVTIADMNSLQVEADVSESNLGKVRISQPCEIQLDSLPGLRFRGQVHVIVPTADRSKATVMVEGPLPGKRSPHSPGNERQGGFLGAADLRGGIGSPHRGKKRGFEEQRECRGFIFNPGGPCPGEIG